MRVIDSHVHFIDPGKTHYPWLSDPALEPINKRFAPEDLHPLLTQNGVDAAVLVQTRSSLEETREYLQIAERHDFIVGVVGWVDLTSPSVDKDLAELKAGASGRLLVGVRHQVEDEADPNWLLEARVQRGLAAVRDAGICYDLLVRTPHLPAATQTVRRFPDLRFVVDHIAKPPITEGHAPEWARLMSTLSREPNVMCKLSGMVTQAHWGNWTADDLKPFVEQVLEWFGSSRCLYGSDWPVCVLAAEYAEVKAALAERIDELPQEDQRRIWGENAETFYQLPSTESRG